MDPQLTPALREDLFSVLREIKQAARVGAVGKVHMLCDEAFRLIDEERDRQGITGQQQRAARVPA